MKTIVEYLINNHISNAVDVQDIITDKKPTGDDCYNFMCVRIPNAKSDVLYYVNYTDLEKVKAKEFINYSYTLYDKAETKYGTSTLPIPSICFQFYSHGYDDFVTGYFVSALDDKHTLSCIIDPKHDKEHEYKQIQHYFEQ